jgi:hypothetical protein
LAETEYYYATNLLNLFAQVLSTHTDFANLHSAGTIKGFQISFPGISPNISLKYRKIYADDSIGHLEIITGMLLNQGPVSICPRGPKNIQDTAVLNEIFNFRGDLNRFFVLN